MKIFKRIVNIVIIMLVFTNLNHASDLEKLNIGIERLADKIIKQMKRNGIKLIAMGDFVNTSGGKSQFEKNIEIGLVNDIVGRSIPDISIIERKNLSEVLKEQKLGNTGLLERKTRAKLGKILGVEAIITGITTVLKREVKVNIRMYSITTGRILAAPSYTFARNETIDELLEESVRIDTHSKFKVSKHHKRNNKQKAFRENSNNCFSNKFIRICSKASRSKDKKRITITTTLENNSDKDLYLGQIVVCKYQYDNQCRSEYSDNFNKYYVMACKMVADGKDYIADRISGLPTFFRRWVDRNKVSIDNFALLSGGSKLSITYSFSSKEDIEGDYIDFSSDAVLFYTVGKGDKFKKMKFTISGIELPLKD